MAMEAMAYERGLFVLERTSGLRRRLAELSDVLGEPTTNSQQYHLGRIRSDLDLLEAQVLRTIAQQEAGTLRPGATSIDKLWLAEVYQELYGLGFDLLVDSGGVGDSWIHDLLESRSVSIYSGTSEIQRNVIARQLLGLR